MSTRKTISLGITLLLTLILLSVVGAFAASNTVPFTRLDDDSNAITANDLKPSECSGINVSGVYVVSGFGGGSGGNDLILGTSSGDIIFGFGGDDCIVAGGGNDFILGGGGTDVCNGGAGSDTAFGCETEIDIP